MDTTKLSIYGPSPVDIGNGDGPIELQEIIYGPDPSPGEDFVSLGYTFSEEHAAELVKRWNAYPKALDRIHDLLETAGRVEDMMDGDRDKQEAWTEELGRLYVAIDETRAFLNTLKA